jgi:hypothetical protein
VTVVVTGVLVIFALGIGSFSWFEETFLTMDSERVVLQVIRMESTNSDHAFRNTFRYVVALPDRTQALLLSERMYRVGTRLEATTSRSRITKKVLVAGPYIVLAE